MKKLVVTLFTLLLSLHAGAILPGSYTDPSQLPAAFTWNLVRYDYRGTDVNGDPILVGQREVTVEFDPTFVNSASKYGKLTLKNMYSHESLTLNATGQEFPFDNSRTYWAFQYDEVANTITFSFQATLIGRLKYTTTPYSNSKAAKSSSTYGYIAAAKSEQSSYWNSTETTPYAYGGAQHVAFVIDLENHTITSQGPWGVFYTKESGASPSYVLEYFDYSVFQEPEPTTLAWIVDKGDVNQEYVVADDLVGVKLVPVYGENDNDPVSYLLYAKDYKKFASPDVVKEGQKNYMVKTGVFPDEYDQSNWVALSFEAMETQPNIIQFNNLIGHVIKGGTIKGTYTNDVNPTIAVTQLPTGGDAMVYDPNVYIVPSFCDEYAEEESQYFFVQPKPQEYCTVQWANYDATTNAFYVPASENGNNGWNLSGGFEWQTSYLPSSDRTPEDHGMYTFPAIVKRKITPSASAPRRITTATPKVGSVSSRYEVYPLQIENSSIITGITTVRSDAVDDGYYYTITGQRVSNPTPGFYIRGGKKVIVR